MIRTKKVKAELRSPLRSPSRRRRARQIAPAPADFEDQPGDLVVVTVKISNPRASNDKLPRSLQLQPTLKLQTDQDVYQPGDPTVVTVEISNPRASDNEFACTSWRDCRQAEESDGKEEESERNNHKKIDTSVNNATPHVALHCSQIFNKSKLTLG